jgi:hypothetical protein
MTVGAARKESPEQTASTGGYPTGTEKRILMLPGA